MSTVNAILQSYHAPRAVLRRHLETGAGEERALAWVMGACFLYFIAQLPRLARQAHLVSDSIPFDALAGGAFLGSVLIAPLFFYGMAALSHLVARAFGGRGQFLRARLALFWALLAVSPLVLLRGLVAGFIGAGPALTAASFVAFAAFLFIWINGLIALEKG